jgi:hypothetical protein
MYDTSEMDRLLWCRECREQARARATRWGWMVGLAAAAALALWIWLVVQPSDLVIGGWIGTVVATAWLGAKAARELVYGAMRFGNRPATDARPPGPPPPPDEPPPEGA